MVVQRDRWLREVCVQEPKTAVIVRVYGVVGVVFGGLETDRMQGSLWGHGLGVLGFIAPTGGVL